VKVKKATTAMARKAEKNWLRRRRPDHGDADVDTVAGMAHATHLASK
jgi:hypothetical protein